jgi:hypothetical protein
LPDSATRAVADAAHSENGGYCDVAAVSEKADAVGDRGDLLVLHTLSMAPLDDPEAQRQLVLAVPRSRKRSPAARRARPDPRLGAADEFVARGRSKLATS